MRIENFGKMWERNNVIERESTSLVHLESPEDVKDRNEKRCLLRKGLHLSITFPTLTIHRTVMETGPHK